VTLQDLILHALPFLGSQGCLIHQPLDLEVGAGTSHPETTLRVLGPRHWNVAYVQPSRRPDDGRFGENPNRLFKHHQFQVIMKPAPDEIRRSTCRAWMCGIEPRQHDIRFEEDNWESPTLGAWGSAGRCCSTAWRSPSSPTSAGGGHRPAAGVGRNHVRPRAHRHVPAALDNVYDLQWAPGVSYRGGAAARRDRAVEVRVRPGRHAARRVRGAAPHLFDKYYAFAEVLLRSGLVLPALEHCLKCSHLFNILDSSGGIGVTERTAYILRVRQLAVGIARAYAESEEQASAPAGPAAPAGG